ncbi:hypothetical protein ACFVVU_23550 [Kitasatospora sp. NPDC057965]|uniref:hypothetical protein n=1 Tax=Kitasatospora sp. NPDC057965 TaxID=3346291 RepID=UPI0036D8BC1C
MYIGHICGCGHPDVQHQADAPKSKCQAIGGLSCGKGCRKSTKAVLRPTFTVHRPVETITPPGERVSGNNGWKTCDCDNCRALYAELTGA